MLKNTSFILYISYSGFPIKWTPCKADIFLRRTVYLGMDGFTVKLLWKNIYKVDNYKADSRKTDTFFRAPNELLA